MRKNLGWILNRISQTIGLVSHPEDFHSLEPNHNWMRPDQKTEVKGLYLAGDYTRQPHFATMEGAVVSGQKAARLILKERG
ncbi:FAD-dependent oxidoreductase [Litchfieldia alkalitelluris]|uniref:FAD-dependent oxidoreductase n=1 Tax=Litchfieldia alkalitelluris TaxID=304268 RepID=UPI001F33A0FF|nr:FAD-dependent oxidoreductase [Litchfieldia alkalitelluris]